MLHWTSLRWRNHRQEWGGNDQKLLLAHPRAGNNVFMLDQQDEHKLCATCCWRSSNLSAAGTVLHQKILTFSKHLQEIQLYPHWTSVGLFLQYIQPPWTLHPLFNFRSCTSPVIAAKVMKVKMLFSFHFILLEMIFGGTKRTLTGEWQLKIRSFG